MDTSGVCFLLRHGVWVVRIERLVLAKDQMRADFATKVIHRHVVIDFVYI